MNGRSNLSLASCSSLMTDCHMARVRERGGRKKRERRRRERKEREGKVTLLHMICTNYY